MASNPSPSAVLHRRINFATVNETNGNVIPEPFRVFGPYAQGVRITRLQLGNKAVIPLTTETGEGAFFLKLHFPHVVGNNMNMSQIMFVTFCAKNQAYDDGYRDYVQRVPAEYVAALKYWIDNGRTPSTSGTIRYRKLSFTAYGEETSQANNAVSFEMRFNYRGANVNTTYPGTPNDTSVGGNVRGATGSSSSTTTFAGNNNDTRTR